MSRDLEALLQRTAAETGLPVEPDSLVRRGRRRRRLRHAATAVATFAVVAFGAVTVSSLTATGPPQPEIVGQTPTDESSRTEQEYSAIEGTWEGRSVETSGADKSGEGFIVRATFHASPDERGVVGTATWFYADGTATCDVDLHANRADHPEYVVAEFVTATLTEDRCNNGFVELTLRDDGTLVYAYGPRTPGPITLHLTRTDPAAARS